MFALEPHAFGFISGSAVDLGQVFTECLSSIKPSSAKWGCWGKDGGMDNQAVWDRQVLTAIFEMDNQQGLLCSTENSAQCYVAAWMGREFGWDWKHVYMWLNPFAMHLKLSRC